MFSLLLIGFFLSFITEIVRAAPACLWIIWRAVIICKIEGRRKKERKRRDEKIEKKGAENVFT